MEKAFKRYTIKAKNLYPVVAALLHLRVPFEYIPKKKCGMKNYPTRRETNQIEFELPWIALSPSQTYSTKCRKSMETPLISQSYKK